MATWVFIGDELAINPEQALTPQGKPLEVGVIAEGVVWMLDTTEAHYFSCDRQVLGANELSRVWIDNMIGEYLGYTISARGKGNPRLMGADPACLFFHYPPVNQDGEPHCLMLMIISLVVVLPRE